MSTDIVSIQILLYFISVLTQLHSGAIMTLVEILVNILDKAHIEGEFYIDVILHLEEEEKGIGNDPSVVSCKTTNFMLYISVPTTIFWIVIVINFGLITEFLKIVLTAVPVLHAGCIRLMLSTWAMSHLSGFFRSFPFRFPLFFSYPFLSPLLLTNHVPVISIKGGTGTVFVLSLISEDIRYTRQVFVFILEYYKLRISTPPAGHYLLLAPVSE